MPKRRQYIDKKHCQRFTLVPNATFKHLEPIQNLTDAPDIKKEQHKYGIFYDDGYNYLKHLKSSSDYAGELLQVFRIEKTPATETNSQMARVDEDKSLDPEIAVTFQGEFDFNNPENELEDDFVQMANGDVDMEDLDTLSSSGSENCSEYNESLEDEYDKNTDLLNERFEKLYESYKDEDIGALDDVEFEENANMDEIILENLLKSSSFPYQKEPEDDVKPPSKTNYLSESSSNSDSNDSQDSTDEKPKEIWDCESVLSKPRCNPYRSMLIKDPFKIAISKKGIPLDDGLTSLKLTGLDKEIRKSLEETESINKRDTVASHPILEDKLQNKQRKQAIKQEKRERRVEKKQNKNAFRHEQIKTQTLHIHNLHNHPSAIKIP